MINISDETIQAWYIEFLREKWSSKKFNERVSGMKFIKTYGERIDIADWFEKEAIYTYSQVEKMTNERLSKTIKEADILLSGRTIEIDLPTGGNMDAIAYRIARTITVYYREECEEQSKEIVKKLLPAVLEEMGIKQMGKHYTSRGNVKFSF